MRIFCSLILALSLLSCGGPSAQQGGGEKVDFTLHHEVRRLYGGNYWQSLGG